MVISGVHVRSPSPCWMTLTKDFAFFAMEISSDMAKISLSFESHGIGCKSPVSTV